MFLQLTSPNSSKNTPKGLVQHTLFSQKMESFSYGFGDKQWLHPKRQWRHFWQSCGPMVHFSVSNPKKNMQAFEVKPLACCKPAQPLDSDHKSFTLPTGFVIAVSQKKLQQKKNHRNQTRLKKQARCITQWHLFSSCWHMSYCAHRLHCKCSNAIDAVNATRPGRHHLRPQ